MDPIESKQGAHRALKSPSIVDSQTAQIHPIQIYHRNDNQSINPTQSNPIKIKSSQGPRAGQDLCTGLPPQAADRAGDGQKVGRSFGPPACFVYPAPPLHNTYIHTTPRHSALAAKEDQIGSLHYQIARLSRQVDHLSSGGSGVRV